MNDIKLHMVIESNLYNWPTRNSEELNLIILWPNTFFNRQKTEKYVQNANDTKVQYKRKILKQLYTLYSIRQ